MSCIEDLAIKRPLLSPDGRDMWQPQKLRAQWHWVHRKYIFPSFEMDKTQSSMIQNHQEYFCSPSVIPQCSAEFGLCMQTQRLVFFQEVWHRNEHVPDVCVAKAVAVLSDICSSKQPIASACSQMRGMARKLAIPVCMARERVESGLKFWRQCLGRPMKDTFVPWLAHVVSLSVTWALCRSDKHEVLQLSAYY